MDGTFPPAYGRGGDINKPALTLIELLTASAVSLIVAGIIIVIYIMLQTSWQDTSAVLEIGRTANLAMERIMRGLFEARSFTIVGGSKINFVNGIDMKQGSFYLQGGKLMYDPDTSVASDEKPFEANVSALAFTADAGSPAKAVLISLTVSKSVKGVEKTMSLSSTVVLRNA